MSEKVQNLQPLQPLKPHNGKVYLIGAGPGDPDLITVKGLKALVSATCVIYDALANPLLLNYARPDAEMIDAGKRAKKHKLTQDETNSLMLEKAKAGHIVARLKGGDPYVFGRGSEEGIYLHSHGVAVEMIPGITAAMAGPAYAGIPVTHRNIATTVTFITGHENPTKGELQTDYEGLAKIAIKGGTLCFYMGMGRLPEIVSELNKHGLPMDTPAAVVQWGTMPKQKSVRGTMTDIADKVAQAGLGAPSIILVGGVAAVDKDEALRYFEKRPLFGKRIVVTRTRHQSSELAEQLTDLGADVLLAPTIQINPPADWTPVDDAINNIKNYDWLILTSANGVAGLRERLQALNLDARHLAGVKIAVVGDQTANALNDIGLQHDLMPNEFVGESLAAALIENHDMSGKKILMLRADIARPMLKEKLTEAGATVNDVAIYETTIADRLPENVIQAVEQQDIDWVTFTSSSTVRHFATLLGNTKNKLQSDNIRIASIGPVTSNTARELDIPVTVEAKEHNIQGLIQAIRDAS